MGDVFSCFKTDAKSERKIQSSEQLPSIDDVKFWEGELGLKDESLLLKFAFDEENINHHSFKQIYKDVVRTFPQLKSFSNKHSHDKFILSLKKFAIYFPKTGYTQGLNFLTGYLVISQASQKQTFTILAKMCIHPSLMMLGLYEDYFPLNRLYCEIFWAILEKKCEKLTACLRKAAIPDEIWIFQWFMTLFIISFPLQLIKYFWNYLFSKRQFSFVRLAFGIVRELQSLLTDPTNDDADYLTFFENLKSLQFCHQNLPLSNVFKHADSLTEGELKAALKKTTLNNFYTEYFMSGEEQRKNLYLLKMNRLREERRSFLKDPKLSSFSREENQISFLDYIVAQHQRMYHSLDLRKIGNDNEPKRYSVPSQKFWKSDVQQLNVVLENLQTGE